MEAVEAEHGRVGHEVGIWPTAVTMGGLELDHAM